MELTLEGLTAFAEIYKQISLRVEFIAREHGHRWSVGDAIDFSDWDPSVPNSVFAILWGESHCGDYIHESAYISTSDLFMTTEALVEERRLRLLREEEERQEATRAARERALRMERAHELSTLRRLMAKYPEEVR